MNEMTQVLGIVAMVPKGAYDSETFYEKLNVVTYQGSSYCAKASVQGVLPTDTTYWELIAEKGDTGATGATGAQGPKPVKGVDYYTASDIADLESTLSNDVHSEVVEQLSDLSSGSPAGVYATTTDIVSDNPDTGVYLVTADGHIYYWIKDDVSPTDLGLYQATQIETDKTLSIDGGVADAKTTGDEISDIKTGEPILNNGNLSYADEFNETDIATYMGGNTYNQIQYTHQGGKYGISLLSEYDPNHFNNTFSPYITMGTNVYIPFDKHKRLIFKCDTNSDGFCIIRFGYYDANKNQVGSNVGIACKNGINIIDLLQYGNDGDYIKYLKFYQLGADRAKSLASTYCIISGFVCEDLDYENLNSILNANKNYPDALLYRSRISDYYFNPTEQTPTTYDNDEYLESKIKSVPRGRHFIFITDTHWEGNAKKSIDLLQYVRGRLKIDNVIHGGDVLDKKPTKFEANIFIKQYMNKMVDGIGNSLLQVLGNHDLNTANVAAEDRDTYMLSYKQCYNIYMKHLEGKVHFCEQNDIVRNMTATDSQKTEVKYWLKMNYYWDDDYNKTRYIVINTGNPQAGNGVVYDLFGIYGIGEVEGIYKWLIDILKTVPDNYSIVLIGHNISSSDGTISSAFAQSIFKILKARKTKSTVSITNNWGNLQGLWDKDTMGSVDYTDMTNRIDKVFVMTGHWHYDKNTTYEDIPCITTQCDAYGRASYADSSPMTLNTITEQCFDIVTITNNSIVCTRIGAGNDRTINFS